MSADEIFSFKELDLGEFPDSFWTSKDFEIFGDEGRKLKNGSGEDWGEVCEIGSFSPGLSFDQELDQGCFLSKYQPEKGQLSEVVDYGEFEDLYFDIVSPALHLSTEEIEKLLGAEPEKLETAETEQERPNAESLEIQNNQGGESKGLNGECAKLAGQKLSTPEILRLAGEKFIKSSSTPRSDLSMLGHPYPSSFLRLSEGDRKDIELLQNLLAAAEKVGEQHFRRAGKLLKKCKIPSLDKGNSVQRLVHYFSGALREKIDRETGRCSSRGSGKLLHLSVERSLSTANSTVLAFEKAVPFSHVNQFAGVQAILEQVADDRRIHIIDLQIRMGMQYTMLMQALASRADCPVESLKITAIGTNCKGAIEETGSRLTSFAKSFNLPFSFSMVIIEDMIDLTEEHFEIDDDEAVAVYSEYVLMLMLARPDRLESLMRVIQAINPRIMIVTEIEANNNSPIFVNRFTEALFFYGAYFDAFEDCFHDDETTRTVLEAMFFSRAIKNIVAAEGEERTMRHVKIDIWRKFFRRFRMVEVELSMSSLYQANSMLKRFLCGSSCTFNMDGKCLTVCWKGIPIQSLSAWKFK